LTDALQKHMTNDRPIKFHTVSKKTQHQTQASPHVGLHHLLFDAFFPQQCETF